MDTEVWRFAQIIRNPHVNSAVQGAKEARALRTLTTLAALTVMSVASIGQDTIQGFQEALKANPKSSSAHYGIAEIRFHERSFQAAANEYRAALMGDLRPRWTKVWSYIGLGKVFDVTGQRERAVA